MLEIAVCPCVLILLLVKEFMRRLVLFRSSVSLALALLLAVPFNAFPGDDNNKKSDPDAIGDRNVSGKVNWYSLEKEIALGKHLPSK